jgi:hypothetical protein
LTDRIDDIAQIGHGNIKPPAQPAVYGRYLVKQPPEYQKRNKYQTQLYENRSGHGPNFITA